MLRCLSQVVLLASPASVPIGGVETSSGIAWLCSTRHSPKHILRRFKVCCQSLVSTLAQFTSNNTSAPGNSVIIATWVGDLRSLVTHTRWLNSVLVVAQVETKLQCLKALGRSGLFCCGSTWSTWSTWTTWTTWTTLPLAAPHHLTTRWCLWRQPSPVKRNHKCHIGTAAPNPERRLEKWAIKDHKSK